MNRISRDVILSLAVAGALVTAIAMVWLVMVGRAHADGMLAPPPPIAEGPPLFSLPVQGVQGPPTQSCIETAIQLAYQTGSRQVGNAAAAACKYYAPVQFPRADRYYGPPLGWQPPPR